jgi:hypothetical protein
MIIYLKANDLELDSGLTPIEFISLADIAERGEIHLSIAVTKGERCGFIPLLDIDVERTIKALHDLPNQLPLVLM